MGWKLLDKKLLYQKKFQTALTFFVKLFLVQKFSFDQTFLYDYIVSGPKICLNEKYFGPKSCADQKILTISLDQHIFGPKFKSKVFPS